VIRWFGRRLSDSTPEPVCEVHGGARVMEPHFRDDAMVLDLDATVDRLLALQDAGRMRTVRGDCRLDALRSIVADERYLTYAVYLECLACGGLTKVAVNVRSSYPLYLDVPWSQLESNPFHDWPELVDTRPDLPIRLQR
jgi:hypothetical protein